MSSVGPGCGVQVLSVEADGTYRADNAALMRVATHEAARALPVAVVSVAGVTRGGKSFLLDFFLRYLRAPEAARRDGSWIGADTDPLTGFSWRGGWQRDTTGLLLWSEPIIVTQEVNGQPKKIAVLLMDTQGTFDHTSTVKDCTTIFAMSTLISSVQIYNLAQIIKEDDLQHLQLFTEYGKLACVNDSKPFQALIFRVRDWMCPYEHSYGAKGGESYLKTVLQAQTTTKEIIDVRDHIRFSFETVSCFLMPHPGMAVTDKNFSGRLCDISSEFKESLLEFVPSIFHPSKLVPKTINGQVVTTGELPTYFQTYLEIFNSNTLPTPLSIFQATSLACLETSLSATREEYCSRMDRGTAKCVARIAVPRLHQEAIAAARALFASRRSLAAPPHATARLETLMQELEAMLSNYVAINGAKILQAATEARAAYEAAVRKACGERPPCLHPCDAPVLHAEAGAAAMVAFNACGLPLGDDPDRDEMLRWLDAKGMELQTSNDVNNAAMRLAAGALYMDRMQRATRGGALGAERLRSEHEAARHAACNALRDARCRASAHSDDQDHFMTELRNRIEEEFVHWESSNKKNCRSALRAVAASYNTRMAAAWGGLVCLHPNSLRREHDAACANALAELREEANTDEGSQEELQLAELLQARYSELVLMNGAANASLVSTAFAEYRRLMDSKCAPSLTSIAIVPWLLKVLVHIPTYHQRSTAEAMDFFRSRRRCTADDDDDEDEYISKLKERLHSGYNMYCNPLLALARELNLVIG